jgi:hypothetical protein
MHLRDAWNGAIGTNAETRFEHQGIVLTVPASFDEDARELTVEAARRAGLDKLTLLERQPADGDRKNRWRVLCVDRGQSTRTGRWPSLAPLSGSGWER